MVHSFPTRRSSDLWIELVRNAFLKNRTDGALVRLSSPVQGGVEQTTERMVAYVQALYPVLPEYLPN